MNKPLIIGHRGASFDAPENTLASMKLAWEQRADAIEMDLHLSKDRHIVVIHDADTRRTGGVARKVADQTWEELQRLDVGRWKDARFTGERLPALESILATVPPRRRAVLEIKCGPEVFPELERVITASGRKPSELVIISFDYETLRQSKQRFPSIEHCFLQGYKQDAKTGELPRLSDVIQKAEAAGFEGLNLHFDWPIDAAFVSATKAAGLKLFVWTVDDPAVAKRLAAAGVDGITTNRPEWLREQLKGSP